MSAATAFTFELPAAAETAASRFNAHLLSVTFENPAGERSSAIGGGESVPEAIAAARGELQADVHWTLVRWNPLYGE
jgi:hypothetical protein